MTSESSKNAKGSQCFKCQGYDHIVTQYPSKNLIVKKADDDKIETIVYEPTGSATDSDDGVKIFSIQLGVLRCSHTTIRDEDWHRSSMFHTYTTH